MIRPASRLLAVMALVGAAIVASLVGGVGVGHATTTISVSITPLIANGSSDPVPQVSLGGKIGYEVVAQNAQQSSNATHVQVIVDVPTATFFDANQPGCAAAKGNPSKMICTPPGGTLNAGSTYTVDFRFTAPTSGSSVTATPSVSIAAQTQGGKQNGTSGTLVATGTPVDVVLNADGSVNDTYLRQSEGASAGGPQNFSAQLPNALFGTQFGLELGIHNQTGTPICATCLPTFTELTIPAASSVTNVGNPFYNGTDPSRPYTWTMSATVDPSFKLAGIFHVPDPPNDTPVQIPACAILPLGGPTLTDPVCYDTLTSKTKAGAQTLTATGRGLENGKITFGA